MLIGFEFIWDETPLLVEVAKKLAEDGNKIIGVTLGNRWNSLLKGTDFTLVNLGDYLRANWNKIEITNNLLEECEKEYGKNHDLSFFISVDRLINDVNKTRFKTLEDKQKFLVLHFEFWEDFFEEYKVDCFYTTGIAFLGLLTGMAVAEQKGVKFKAIRTTPASEGRIVLVDNYLDHWERVNKSYEMLLKRELTREEEAFAKSFLEEFRRRAERPIYMKHSWHISGLRPMFIKEFLQRLRYRYFHKWGAYKFDYVTPPLFNRVLKELKVIVKRKILTSFYFKRKKTVNDHYVFFSLQLQPEWAADICGRWYSNQIAAVENISKVLPLNYKLYVKEHKVAVGRREGLFSYYDKIRELPNVVLIHPFEDSHDLIAHADLVIVIVGTVGWEALLYGKPVITLGDTFYNDSDLVYKLKNLDEIKSAIHRSLRNYRLDEGKLLRYIAAMRYGTHRGYFNVPHCDNNVLTEQNIKNVSEAIRKDLGNE